MNHRHDVRNPRAFTLIELLVVVAIIALLISILLPSLQAARDRAKGVKCAALQKQIGNSTMYYVMEHRGWYIPHSMPLGTPPGSGVGIPYGQQMLWFFNPDFRIGLGLDSGRNRPDRFFEHNVPEDFVCPSATLARHDTSLWDGGNYPYTPEIKQQHSINYSYGYNSTHLRPSSQNATWYRGYREANIKQPAEKLAFADAVDWNIMGNHRYNDKYGQNGENYDWTYSTGKGSGVAWRHQTAGDHGVINVSFFDGHAQGLRNDKVVVPSDQPAFELVKTDQWRLWSVLDEDKWPMTILD